MEFLEKDCTNYSMCAECGGRCCKETGCFFMPQDFEKIEYNYLKNEIETKQYISISAVNSFFGIVFPIFRLYLKVRNVDSEICNVSTPGTCMLLTPTGCALNFRERPTGGKALIPGNPCTGKIRGDEAVAAWRPYEDILKRLWNDYSDIPFENL